MEDYIQQVLGFDAREGAPMRIEKMVAFYTSRDRAISEPLGNAGSSVRGYPPFARALHDHRNAWNELWATCDLAFPSDARVQRLLRFNVAHILQVCSPHTTELDAGVLARGL